jgi:hypothetical protein
MRTWLTITDLSEYLQVPETRIRLMVKNFQIPFHDRLGTPRFFKTEIDDWMRSEMTVTEKNQGENENFTYHGKSIKNYKLSASKVLIGPTALNRLPGFIKKSVETFNKTGQTFLLRNQFEPLINNFNDYLRISCQLGLIDNIREGRTTHYTPTEYAQEIFNAVDTKRIKKIIIEGIFNIVKMGKEEIPRERHAIFLLWYLLKLRINGVVPEEFHFNRGGEITHYPKIRLNFSKSLCNFLFEGDKEEEKKMVRKWDQYI